MDDGSDSESVAGVALPTDQGRGWSVEAAEDSRGVRTCQGPGFHIPPTTVDVQRAFQLLLDYRMSDAALGYSLQREGAWYRQTKRIGR